MHLPLAASAARRLTHDLATSGSPARPSRQTLGAARRPANGPVRLALAGALRRAADRVAPEPRRRVEWARP
jgi:hypothetical protein